MKTSRNEISQRRLKKALKKKLERRSAQFKHFSSIYLLFCNSLQFSGNSLVSSDKHTFFHSEIQSGEKS